MTYRDDFEARLAAMESKLRHIDTASRDAIKQPSLVKVLILIVIPVLSGVSISLVCIGTGESYSSSIGVGMYVAVIIITLWACAEWFGVNRE